MGYITLKENNDLEEQIKRIQFYESKYGVADTTKWYSLGFALKKYLGLPQFIPLFVYIDHGVPIYDDPVQSDLTTRLPILSIRKSRQEAIKKKCGKDTYVMGSPYVHYRKLRHIERDPEAKGTIVFASHSTHLVDIVLDWHSYAERLLDLPSIFYPLTVCLYWKDLLNDIQRPFLERSIPVVTAGHMADPDFIDNFYNILRTHLYSTSNMFGSYVFYSVEMGIPFFLYGDLPKYNNYGGDRNRPIGEYSPHEVSPSTRNFANNFTFDISKPIVVTDQVRDKCIGKLGLDIPIKKTQLRRVIIISLIRNGPAILALKTLRVLKKAFKKLIRIISI